MRHSLNLESGLNDGLALPPVLALSAALSLEHHHFVWWKFVLQDVTLGLLYGIACGLVASRVNWLADPPAGPLKCTAKIRYRHAGVAATVTALADGGAEVRFAQPQPAVTPGQAVAFYDGTRVLGGGWIERAVK